MALKLVTEEISIRNCIWALRLRTYYNKPPVEAAKYLMDIKINAADTAVSGVRHFRGKNSGGKEISLAREALQSLDFQLDTRSEWHGWRWEKLLNPEQPQEVWVLNPRYFQNSASQYLYRLAMRSFHRMPMSVSMAFCFIKIKQFEEDLLTSVTEGLGLGMTCGDGLELLEIPA
jgi:hypothetical protein